MRPLDPSPERFDLRERGNGLVQVLEGPAVFDVVALALTEITGRHLQLTDDSTQGDVRGVGQVEVVGHSVQSDVPVVVVVVLDLLAKALHVSL